MTSSEHALSCKALVRGLEARYQLLLSPSKHCPENQAWWGGLGYRKVIMLGQRVDIFAQGIREHVRLGSKLSKTVKGKLSLGAKILQVGRVGKVFQSNFDIRDDEMLLQVSQCYLSTAAGPIAGLLFISNSRVAFCSERSIKFSLPTGRLLRAQYKVSIPLSMVKRISESENVKRPVQKYVQLVTEDNFDFWFMGFLNHQRTLKYIQEATDQAR